MISEFLNNPPNRRSRFARSLQMALMVGIVLSLCSAQASAQQATAPAPVVEDSSAPAPNLFNWKELISAAGPIGLILVVISILLVMLSLQYLISLRRSRLQPRQLADQLHPLISKGDFEAADQLCRSQPSMLSYLVRAGLREVKLGYSAVEKALEDATAEQSARLLRKVETLNVIHAISPMIGLLGTVWGMIQAFVEFEAKTAPLPSDLAPGIYKALVTTLLGLTVAIPALAIYSYFRNRVEELMAETALIAEFTFSGYKHSKGPASVSRERTTASVTRNPPSPRD